MRTKSWNANDLVRSADLASETRQDDQTELTDRVQALLDQMAGGEGGGAPCSVGVPPWFLKAARSRLTDLTRGTSHEDFVQEVFRDEVATTVSPDKLALALAVIDETFVKEIADQTAQG